MGRAVQIVLEYPVVLQLWPLFILLLLLLGLLLALIIAHVKLSDHVQLQPRVLETGRLYLGRHCALPDDDPLELGGVEVKMLNHVRKQLGNFLVAAQLAKELERLERGRQADRLQPRLPGGLAEELVVPVHAQRGQLLKLAQGERLVAGQGGKINGDGLQRGGG
ncbi:hypothetical protein HYQ46_012667 [Verticillium longisporum]|nr:hypothetical protein HYQ46_012667 [Verticillium longisporum]